MDESGGVGHAPDVAQQWARRYDRGSRRAGFRVVNRCLAVCPRSASCRCGMCLEAMRSCCSLNRWKPDVASCRRNGGLGEGCKGLLDKRWHSKRTDRIPRELDDLSSAFGPPPPVPASTTAVRTATSARLPHTSRRPVRSGQCHLKTAEEDQICDREKPSSAGSTVDGANCAETSRSVTVASQDVGHSVFRELGMQARTCIPEDACDLLEQRPLRRALTPCQNDPARRRPG